MHIADLFIVIHWFSSAVFPVSFPTDTFAVLFQSISKLAKTDASTAKDENLRRGDHVIIVTSSFWKKLCFDIVSRSH